MPMLAAALTSLAVLAQSTPPGGPAQPSQEAQPSAKEALSSAETIIERCIEATGGRAAWEAITSIRGMGTVSLTGLPAQGRFMVSQTRTGFRMDVDMFSQGPDAAWVKVTSQSTVRNGDHTWREGENAPPRLVTGPTRDDLLRKSTFNPLLDLDRWYDAISVEGMEEVDGNQCWKIKLEPKDPDDPTELRWFGVDDGLMIKLAQTPAGGGVTSELTLSDYRPVGGVLLNHVMIVSNLGASFERRFDAMQIDVSIDPCLFEPPASIASLPPSPPQGEGQPTGPTSSP
ncbi:MAG: outer membrane lipoprotein-sorting protein [Phycisphaerales bacterium]|nr:outer membrane lipoprotein-sorting protein [Phycisphaerales bacterium]